MTDTPHTPDTSELLAKAVKGAQTLEIKRILEKVRNQEALAPRELKTLEEYQRLQEEKKVLAGDREFRNALDVAQYLKGAGWKINKSSVYAHIKQGKLRPDDAGAFTLKAVEKYAASFLTMKSTHLDLKDEELQRRKLRCEIERIQEQTRRERLRRMIEEGRYLPREQFELELAARAVVIDTLRRNSIMSDAAELVAIAAGDPDKVPDLIQFMLARHDDEMNQFATVKEFHVLFEKTESAKVEEKE